MKTYNEINEWMAANGYRMEKAIDGYFYCVKGEDFISSKTIWMDSACDDAYELESATVVAFDSICEPSKFDSLDEFAEWLNAVSEIIADGDICWSNIKDAVEASGWEFNAANIFIAYDNEAKAGVSYMVQRNGQEIAVVE